MKATKLNYFPVVIFILGLLIIIASLSFESEPLSEVKLSNLLLNLGIYASFVVAFQFFYDKLAKDEMIKNVLITGLSRSNVVSSGIDDYVQDTIKIDYSSIFSSAEEVIIGFHHSGRIVKENYDALKERVAKGRTTTILLSDPNGNTIEYLANLTDENMPESIRTVNKRVGRIASAQDATKKKILVKYHNAILRYSFVHSVDGIWVKMYRNSHGYSKIPGIFIRSGSPLYDFFDKDIQTLKESSSDV